MLSLAEGDGRFVVIHQENRGAASARNTGMEFARGRYAYFFDSDDLLEDCALEVLADRADRDHLDVLYFDAESLYESKDLEDRFPHFKSAYKRFGSYDGIYEGADLLALFYRNHDECVSSPLAFFRSDFLCENSLRFLDGIVQEDNGFYFATGLHAERVAHIPLSLYKRRVREGSTMTSRLAFRNVYGYYTAALDMLKEYFAQEHSIAPPSRGPLKAIAFRTLNNAFKIMAHLPISEWHSIYGLRDDCGAMNYAVNTPAWVSFCGNEDSGRLRDERDRRRALEERVAALEQSLHAEQDANALLRDGLAANGAKLEKMREKNRVLDHRCRERKRKLQDERAARRRVEDEIERIRGSHSFRLGRALVRPFAVVKRLSGKNTQERAEKNGERAR